jgi:UrcA family protein
MKASIRTPSRSITSMILVMFVAFAGAAASGRVVAQPYGQVLTKKVTYGDLNLENEAGAKVLYARLRRAAQDVCSPYQSDELARKRVWQTCVENSLSDAVGRINKPLVTALHNKSASRASTG